MNLNQKFFRRRWLDFRNGHGIYLSSMLSFTNFILIAYNFAVKDVSFLHGILSNVAVFTTLFLVVYIPLSVIIGYHHRRHQWVVENDSMYQENPTWAWVTLHQLKVMNGTATESEKQELESYLSKILEKHKKV